MYCKLLHTSRFWPHCEPVQLPYTGTESTSLLLCSYSYPCTLHIQCTVHIHSEYLGLFMVENSSFFPYIYQIMLFYQGILKLCPVVSSLCSDNFCYSMVLTKLFFMNIQMVYSNCALLVPSSQWWGMNISSPVLCTQS